MRLLLDTHTLLWWAGNDPRLSAKARGLLENPGNQLYVSAASAWEISTKHHSGKLTGVPAELLEDMPSWLIRLGFMELPIRVVHAEMAGSLDGTHRDPFDRMLATQSLLEDMPIVGRDPELKAFGATQLW